MLAGRVRRGRWVAIGTLVVVVTLAGAACSPANQASPSASTANFSTAAPVVATTSSPAASAARPAPTSWAVPEATDIPLARPLASTGSIVVVRADGTLWTVDPAGRSTLLAGTADGTYGFPTWSPDGTRVAAIRTSQTGAAVVVFDAPPDVTDDQAEPAAPLVIFESPTIGPFYLSWTPDGKRVSFLANDSDSLALRIANADGSSALDGSGPGAVVRTGSPLYFDWIDPEHLYAHIGADADAFLGEIDRAGTGVGPTIAAPGPFRSVDVSDDGTFVGYVKTGSAGQDAVVVADRGSSKGHSMPVFDMGAVAFGPRSDLLAAIGAVEPVATSVGFPIGPLRLIDARTGKVRTLLDGDVLGFAWSPDGKTIAALRLVDVVDGGAVTSASPSGSPASSRTEIRLTFVDVASAEIRSDPNVTPSITYINAILAYFDQYALSHRLWAPDSSSILLPTLGADRTERIAAYFPDGSPPITFEGTLAFWSP